MGREVAVLQGLNYCLVHICLVDALLNCVHFDGMCHSVFLYGEV